MALDPTILSLLSSSPARLARTVFDQIVKSRSIRFGELAQRIPDADPSGLRAVLQELKTADLVKELGSAVEDFNTYYVTAEGLEANRKVNS